MTPLSMALFTLFIRRQTGLGVQGDFIEFGVFRGRSAAVIAQNAPRDSEIHLVEVADYPEVAKLTPLHDRLRFHKARSEDLARECGPGEFANIQFSHHDASHYFTNVRTELEFMKHRMSPGGLIVLDDFNFVYSQVIAAYFEMRYVRNFEYEVFLIAGGKAYLCHKDLFEQWEQYICSDILGDLAEMGLRCFVSRTDNTNYHRPFMIDRKKTDGQPDFYGVNIWGERFYKPGKTQQV